VGDTLLNVIVESMKWKLEMAPSPENGSAGLQCSHLRVFALSVLFISEVLFSQLPSHIQISAQM
jgi:hypothetical protein